MCRTICGWACAPDFTVLQCCNNATRRFVKKCIVVTLYKFIENIFRNFKNSNFKKKYTQEKLRFWKNISKNTQINRSILVLIIFYARELFHLLTYFRFIFLLTKLLKIYKKKELTWP